jgi:membrane protease YdiL (CAAX protease family)
MPDLLSWLPPAPKLPLLVEPLVEPSAFHAFLALPLVKSLLPFPILVALAYPLFRLCKSTWKELDLEATEARALDAQRGEQDYRPAVCLVLCAAILTIQEYYGGRSFYDQVLKPGMLALEGSGQHWLRLSKYDQLYGYGWWALSRVLGYVLLPIFVWKLCFPKDRILDLGLRVRGFVEHVWIYVALLAIVLPVMVVVSQQPDFGSYYPFYKLSSRSWFDFLVWEAMYYVQFFALEFFFRGWMVGALRRSMGASAIFVMSLPYCMIHYGKPYLEAHGAIVAGVVLGSLSMKTRSIYAGFLLHIMVAAGMDVLSLYKRGALPQVFWGPG